VRSSSILILALAAGTLAAQEAPPNLDRRVQMFAEMSWPTKITVSQTFGTTDQPQSQYGIGFRFLGEVASAQNWYYEVGGMLDATSYFSFNGSLPDGSTLNLTDMKFTDSYWSVGAAYIAKPNENISYGLHLEARGEYLRLQGGAAVSGVIYQQDHSTTYLRPWVRGSVDYTFTGVGKDAHPYLGFDGCLAVLRTSQTREPDFTNNNMDDRTVKALAPKYSVAVYGGIRF